MRNKKTFQMAQLAILTAILLIFAFTPIGYIKAGPVEITLMILPVAVGSILFGPAAGTFLGLIFGITSAAQGFTGMSFFGASLLNVNPLLFIITCVIPRIFCGLVPGLLFRAFPKKWSTTLRCLIASLFCALTNTVLFVGAVILFFGNCEYINSMRNGQELIVFLVGFVGINGAIEIVVSALVGGGIARLIPVLNKNLVLL